MSEKMKDVKAELKKSYYTVVYGRMNYIFVNNSFDEINEYNYFKAVDISSWPVKKSLEDSFYYKHGIRYMVS